MENAKLNKINECLENSTYAIVEIHKNYNFMKDTIVERVVIDDVFYDDRNDCFEFYLRGDGIKFANESEIADCKSLSIDKLNNKLRELNISVIDGKDGIELLTSPNDNNQEFIKELLAIIGIKRIL